MKSRANGSTNANKKGARTGVIVDDSLLFDTTHRHPLVMTTSLLKALCQRGPRAGIPGQIIFTAGSKWRDNFFAIRFSRRPSFSAARICASSISSNCLRAVFLVPEKTEKTFGLTPFSKSSWNHRLVPFFSRGQARVPAHVARAPMSPPLVCNGEQSSCLCAQIRTVGSISLDTDERGGVCAGGGSLRLAKPFTMQGSCRNDRQAVLRIPHATDMAARSSRRAPSRSGAVDGFVLATRQTEFHSER